jgi:hydrogenase/urease accessory protein HupE
METPMRWRSTGSVLLAAIFFVGVAVTAPTAQAHLADQAAAEIVVAGSTARVTLTVPAGLLAFGEDDRNGRTAGEEIRAKRGALRRFLDGRFRVLGRYRTGGTVVEEAGALVVEPGAPVPAGGSDPAPATHTTLMLVYTWPAVIEALSVRYDLFVPNVSTASCLATIQYGAQVRNVVFTPEHRAATITFGRTPLWQAIGGFITLGIGHILTGYDHMLFLLSLLMLRGSMRAILKIVTAFTVAHSITLSLAVLNVVTLPSRWVESAIALSIFYVAVENVWRGTASLCNRWLVTFGFGLVHGMGFASALREMRLPQANVAVSLVGFNVGVEIGQLAVVILAYLALDVVRNQAWAPSFRRGVSLATALVGALWFVERALAA